MSGYMFHDEMVKRMMKSTVNYDAQLLETAYETGRKQGEAETVKAVLEIINRCGLNNAYDRPSFWYNKGKDYKVIDTKYHRGYDQALADIEEAVKALKGEQK